MRFPDVFSDVFLSISDVFWTYFCTYLCFALGEARKSGCCFLVRVVCCLCVCVSLWCVVYVFSGVFPDRYSEPEAARERGGGPVGGRGEPVGESEVDLNGRRPT